MKNELTLVTALFDLGRGAEDSGLADYQRRPFEEYLQAFDHVLAIDAPLCIYTTPEIEHYVLQRRDRSNTNIIVLTLEDLQQRFTFFDRVQQIRTDPAWSTRADWLTESPQANLPFYNPLVLSKIGMLNDQQLTNPFDTEYFLWIDAGLARTCGQYLGRSEWLRNIKPTLEKFLFICFPYIGGGEVHGYDRDKLAQLAGTDYIRRVARGGLFGGSREFIAKANAMYWRLLEHSLEQGEMGTEESIFTAMTYLEPTLFDRFEIEDDGLIGPYFEALLAGSVALVRTRVALVTSASTNSPKRNPTGQPTVNPVSRPRKVDELSTAFYILTFNQPKQLELLINSWRRQPEFFNHATVYVIDNSTSQEAIDANRAICEREKFHHLPQGNIGICGGRQRAAELFEQSSHDYMFFLEDDMLLAAPDMQPCRAGFVRWFDNLHEKLLGLMEKEKFDFLKLSFSELYGVNSDQWAWYNVPQDVRRQVWPELPELPKLGLASNIPATKIEMIGIFDGLSYATGEIYYSNWPQVVGREGNQRMFLDVKWAHPYEQTWMSHLFQACRAGGLKPAVLLASVINHQRDFHYHPDERVES
jgi:hypothetical protein